MVLSGEVAEAPDVALPDAQPADLIATVPLDPQLLEAALQHFLEQLQAAQSTLVALMARLPSTPWFVTLGALALACEVGRRRLRPSAGGVGMAAAGRRFSWFPNLSGSGPDPE